MTEPANKRFKVSEVVQALALMLVLSTLTVVYLGYFSRPGFSWSVACKYLPIYFAVYLVLYAIYKVTYETLPEHGRDIRADDYSVVGFASASAIAFASNKLLGPTIEEYLPKSWEVSYLSGSKILVLLSAVLLAIAAPRLLNARLYRFHVRAQGYPGKDQCTLILMIWIIVLVVMIKNVSSDYENLLTTARSNPFGKFDTATTTLIAFLFLSLGGFAFWYFSRDLARNSIGLISENTRNGYPALMWSQMVGASETVAGNDARRRFKIYLGVIAAAALAGLASGSLENMAFYAVVAAWLGALGLRGAGKFAMQGQTLGYASHVKTEEERREELTPMTRREDCEAYVEEGDGKLWFCVARGTASEGHLPVVERVPLDSFGNFEEGSHKQWFRPRGSVSETLDWGVIVAQSSVGRIVLVAESLHEQSWLIELLVKLQTTFIGPRDAMLRALKDAEQKRRAHDAPTDRQGSSVDEAPVKPF